LIRDVKNLGKAGDIKEVKDGYGQNFLISKGYAKAASDASARQFQTQEKRRQEAQEAEMERAKELAGKLERLSFKIVKKVGANGSLFGALKKEDVAEALRANGVEIDKRNIEMDTIKAVGNYEVGAKIGFGLHPKFTVEVVSE
jgi:large subunit ribosomal protein L9